MKPTAMVLFAIIALICSVTGQESASAVPSGPTWADEVLIVRAILDSNGLRNVSTGDVCKEENGRMVSLNLTNKTFDSTGIKTLPPAIGRLTALTELKLANNFLTALPVEIGNLASLRSLDLASNQIKELPGSFSNLSNLEKLDIRYNGIEQFPTPLFSLKKLWYLQMWGNKMTALPEGLSELASLKELYLKDNRLEMLPHSIARMKSLTYIDYNFNRICKPSPDVAAWLKAKDKKYLETQKCW